MKDIPKLFVPTGEPVTAPRPSPEDAVALVDVFRTSFKDASALWAVVATAQGHLFAISEADHSRLSHSVRSNLSAVLAAGVPRRLKLERFFVLSVETVELRLDVAHANDPMVLRGTLTSPFEEGSVHGELHSSCAELLDGFVRGGPFALVGGGRGKTLFASSAG